jgi:hypothetical protein
VARALDSFIHHGCRAPVYAEFRLEWRVDHPAVRNQENRQITRKARIAMNLNTDEGRTKLFRAMAGSYKKLEWTRDLNRAMVAQTSGSSYGPGEEPRLETLLYLMRQAADATTMSLAANAPLVSFETSKPELEFFARHFAVHVTKLLQKINIAETIRNWVQDTFYSGLGVLYLHQADTAATELWDGIWIDPGTPMCSNVSRDDHVYDISATRWDHCKYEGHSYRMPLEDLRDSDRFNQKVVKELQPTTRLGFSGWLQRTESLSKGYETDEDDLEDMVDVMDVWMPREGKIYTFAMDPQARMNGKHAPLCTMDWDGPAEGPYPKLTFLTVPENLMGLSMAAQIAALARLANNLMRKAARQGKRQKDITIYTPGAAGDAKTLQATDDGGMACVRDLNEIGQYSTGGVNAKTQAFMESVIQKTDRFAGNLVAKLGLGSQANTLGQEGMIQGQVADAEGHLQLRLHASVQSLIRDLSFMLWHDQAKRMVGRMDVPKVPGATIPSTWTPQFRMGNFADYDLVLDVSAMGYRSPQQQLAAFHQVLTQVYLPMMPLMLQQGGQINMQELTEYEAEKLRDPWIKRIFTFSAPRPGEAPEMPQSTGMPTETTRNYVRQDSPNPANANQAPDMAAWQSMPADPTGVSRPMGLASAA